MKDRKVLLQRYLELALRNLDDYEAKLREENHLTGGEVAYIQRRRDYLTLELTELSKLDASTGRFAVSAEKVGGIDFLIITDTYKDRELTERSYVIDLLGKLPLEFPLEEMIILVKDPSGIWDGWDFVKKTFIPLNASTKEMAIKLLLKRIYKPIKPKHS